ncbi:hypothetical protein GCM10026982_09450 [Nocardiopsis aegyptia]
MDVGRRVEQPQVAFGRVEDEQPVAGLHSQSLGERVRHSSSFGDPRVRHSRLPDTVRSKGPETEDRVRLDPDMTVFLGCLYDT